MSSEVLLTANQHGEAKRRGSSAGNSNLPRLLPNCLVVALLRLASFFFGAALALDYRTTGLLGFWAAMYCELVFGTPLLWDAGTL